MQACLCRIKKCLLATMIGFSFVFVGSTSVAGVEPLVEWTQDKALLKGVRYSNPGGQPVLLVHGFTGNTTAWKEVGEQLAQEGYDVFMFNLRGHGTAEQRSVVHRSGDRVYSFDHMVSYDIPAMVEFVFKKTGQKMLVAGHSLGGMALSAASAGVGFDESEKLRVDSATEKNFSSKVTHLVSIGSPTTFNNDRSPLNKARSFTADLYRSFLNNSFSLRKSHRSPLNKTQNGLDFFRVMTSSAYEWWSRTPLWQANTDGVINLSNLSLEKGELSYYSEHGVSFVELDIVEDILRWVKTKKYLSFDGEINYENLLGRVPYLAIVGELDLLARPEQIKKSLRQIDPKGPMGIITLHGRSHLDLVIGQSAGELTAPFISEFFQTVKPFVGKPDKKCSDALKGN